MTTPPPYLDFSTDVHTIEQSFVAVSSNTSYKAKIVLFMLWLYDNHRSYLSQEYLPMMDERNDEDVKRRHIEEGKNQQQQAPTNEQNSRKESKSMEQSYKKISLGLLEEDRSSLRSYCFALLHKVKPDVEGKSHNSPIKIEGDGAIT